MRQPAVAVPRKHNSKAANISNHVAELVSLTNTIISNIKGQSDVNGAFTKHLLSLEDRISKLEMRMRPPEPNTAAAFPPSVPFTELCSPLPAMGLRAPRIYDCFLFFNELDLLEIRLNELSSVVDIFVIAESNLTFQGKPKPLYFEENRARFAKFHKQIRHVIVNDMPDTINPWEREFHQRNALKLGLLDAPPDATVIISDADEIPTPTAILELKKRKEFTYLQMKFFVYFLNCEVLEGADVPWVKAYAAPWQQIKAIPDLSTPRHGSCRQDYLKTNNLGDLNEHLIVNGGWHFSWLGSPERMIQKLDAFSHTEERTKQWRNSEFLADSIAQKRYFVSDAGLSTRPIEEMPVTIQNACEYYQREGMLAPKAPSNSNITTKVHLPDVTLCALDTANVSLAQRALELSMKGCNFGDVIFVTSEPVATSLRTVIVKPFANVREVEDFWVQRLPQYVNTPFILFIQYDGYVLSPSSWRPEFLDYDYIGAKWPWMKDGPNVGNSGFSLMSKKLLNVWRSPEANPSRTFTDLYLCRDLRPRFERQYGIRFAPESIADLFSYEVSFPQQPTFGFHGLFNLWRHNDDESMERIAREIADYAVLSPSFLSLIGSCYEMERIGPLRALYARLRQKLNIDETLRQLTLAFNEPFARECMAVCETLMKQSSLANFPPITYAPHTDMKQPNEEIDARGRIISWER